MVLEHIRVLIADGAEDFRMALGECLAGDFSLRSCGGGREALALLESFQPQAVVLDMMLPELDGISLLQAAGARQAPPMVLATTRYLSDYLLESANQLGVQYLMVKPCDAQVTAARLRDMTQRLRPAPSPEPDIRARLAGLLQTLDISGKLNGYGYLLEAVPYFGDHPGLSITKELYPAVAACCGSKASQVERSIRSAIQTAWERQPEAWSAWFPHRPTNAEFISRLAELLRQP